MTPLAQYLLAAMTAWSPCRLHKAEPVDTCEPRYASIAVDVVDGVSDPGERVGNITGVALLLVAIADLESGFAPDVDDLSCNRSHTSKRCDSAGAFSIWQIHTEGGLVLDARGFRHFAGQPLAWQSEHASEVIHGPQLVDRKLAARIALHMLRQAGVSPWTQGQNAKKLAASWRARHPPP